LFIIYRTPSWKWEWSVDRARAAIKAERRKPEGEVGKQIEAAFVRGETGVQHENHK
jgi:hypothetical protein